MHRAVLRTLLALAALAFATAQTCPAGQIPDGFGSCSECYAGTYAGIADGAPACLKCPVNTFTDTSGQSRCKECPAGSYSDTEGTVFCTECSYGEFLTVEDGKRVCKKCPQNTFAAAPRSTSCKPCPLGSLTYYDGSSSCEACPVSTVPGKQETGSFGCVNCPDGMYTPKTGSAPCQACATGSYISQDDLDSHSCKLCPVGSASKPGNASKCYPDAITFCCPECLPGTFTAKPGASRCEPCPAGTYQPDKGAAECLPCPPGSYSSAPGSAACNTTSIGFFQPKAGSTGQLACPANTVGLTKGGTTLESTCIPYLKGTYTFTEKQDKVFVYRLSGSISSLSTAVQSLGSPQGRSLTSASSFGPCGGEIYTQETFYSCSRYPYSDAFDKSACVATNPGGKSASSCKTYKFYALPGNKFTWVVDIGKTEPAVCTGTAGEELRCQFVEDKGLNHYIGEWALFTEVKAASADAGEPAGPIGAVGPEVGPPPAIEEAPAPTPGGQPGTKASSGTALAQSTGSAVLHAAAAFAGLLIAL